MRVQFVAGFGPLVRDRQASLAFYRDTLGLPLQGDEYVSADDLEGVKHFGQWTLEDAAPGRGGRGPAGARCRTRNRVCFAETPLLATGPRSLFGRNAVAGGRSVSRLARADDKASVRSGGSIN